MSRILLLNVCLYTFLISNFAGLVAKVEKNLSDHTEFLNYKNEMDKWLAKANETLESCFGIGTENETKQKMEAVTVSVINCGCVPIPF